MLIKDRRAVEDTWTVVGAPAGEHDELPCEGDLIVPLGTWIERSEPLVQRTGRVGVWLGPADEPATLVESGPLPGLIAVFFPAFTDGRGYSTARLLRQRYGYTGELRAIGDILRDQVFELTRCGFDALRLRADQNLDAVLRAFDDFSEVYQAAVDRGPLFARRFAVQGQRS